MATLRRVGLTVAKITSPVRMRFRARLGADPKTTVEVDLIRLKSRSMEETSTYSIFLSLSLRTSTKSVSWHNEAKDPTLQLRGIGPISVSFVGSRRRPRVKR